MAKRRKRNKKPFYTVFMLVLLIVAGIIGFLVWKSFNEEDKPKETSEVEVLPDNNVKEEEKKEETVEKPVEKEKVVQYDGDDPNEASEITGVITYAGVSGSNLMIRVNIDQYLSGGTCKLILTRGGNSIYTASAGVIDAASTSTCEGFNVPVSTIGSGAVNIVINITSGEKTGEIRGEATI
jgi:hypothetical protein